MPRYYSLNHYKRLTNGGPDTPEQVAERSKRREAGEQANREMMERFAPLTPAMMPDALKRQEQRIAELMLK